MFSEKDIHLLKNKGITTDKIEQQLKIFRTGFPYMQLDKPSTPGCGLKTFDDKAINEFVNFYLFCIPNIRNLKFVPASGAASRMFSNLFAFIEKYKNTESQSFDDTDFEFGSAENFIKNIRHFAFFDDLKKRMKQQGSDIEMYLEKHQYVYVIEFLLNEHGLNYAALPKALIKFHNYPEGPRTAIEEHLVEGAKYCYNKNNEIEIHFTISPEHILIFKERLQSVLPYYENLFHVRFLISYSVQKPSTDIIAVDVNNHPFRNTDGSLLFRPGGHGALIHNLNEMDADIVFIKNIDNVVPDSMKDETIRYKMALAGYLLQIRGLIFEYLRLLENRNLPEETFEKIIMFAKNELSHNFLHDFYSFNNFDRITYLQILLNRPIRVCGMVKNQGEPGGGPFVVRDSQGVLSRQIIETSQINLDDEHQKNILNQSTYFNPVDLVCCLRDYKGEKFNLHDFVDPSTGFISHKTKDGKVLKAQELPGLWNGAMAFWNTIFVEVPISTFNPVKTVNDLLRKEHIS